MSEYYEQKKLRGHLRTDRYKTCTLLKEIETGEELLSTREILPVRYHDSDIYHTVKVQEEGRLDLIAQQYYKNPLMWWVIAQANNVYDPFEGIPAGTLIRIPAVESLYGKGGLLL